MQQESEPSVEEILASIKKVIARDNREHAAEHRRRRASLSAASPAPMPKDKEQAQDLEQATDILDLGHDDQCHEVPESDPVEQAEPAETPLLDPSLSAAMRESLDALATLAEPGARPRIVRSGETSLESLVRELLRPILAQWLDQNLPAMVEQMVAAEIARIAGKRS